MTSVTSTAGMHRALGVNFIHEPVLSGRPGRHCRVLLLSAAGSELLSVQSSGPACGHPCPAIPTIPRTSRQIPRVPSPPLLPPAMAAFRKTCSAWEFTLRDSWRVTPHLTINYGLRYDTTFRSFRCFRPRPERESRPRRQWSCLGDSAGPTARPSRRALGLAYGLVFIRQHRSAWRCRSLFQRPPQNGWVQAFNAVNNFNIQNASGPPSLIDPNYHTPYALHATGGYSARLQRQLDSERRLHS